MREEVPSGCRDCLPVLGLVTMNLDGSLLTDFCLPTSPPSAIVAAFLLIADR